MGKAFKHCSQQLGLFFILAWFYAIIRVFDRGQQWQIAFLYELSLKWDTLSTFCNVLWCEICILKNFVTLVFVIELTHGKTILENSLKIKPLPAALDFKNLF